MKIHILGPSGSGTTTLGRLLSEQLDSPFFDCDDFFWEETEVPYTQIRPKEKRSELLKKEIESNSSWVISGASPGWGDILLEKADLIILLYTDREERLERLSRREREQFGHRIMPGGDMYENHKAFLEWAAGYDEGGMEMRSRARLEAWVKRAKGRVLYFYNESTETISRLVTDLYV